MWILYVSTYWCLDDSWRIWSKLNMSFGIIRILHVQIYWRLGLNVNINANFICTNLLTQLERLQLNVLYQYESYKYKFIGDWDWTLTNVIFIRTYQFFLRRLEWLEMNLYINMNLTSTNLSLLETELNVYFNVYLIYLDIFSWTYINMNLSRTNLLETGVEL